MKVVAQKFLNEPVFFLGFVQVIITALLAASLVGAVIGGVLTVINAGIVFLMRELVDAPKYEVHETTGKRTRVAKEG